MSPYNLLSGTVARSNKDAGLWLSSVFILKSALQNRFRSIQFRCSRRARRKPHEQKQKT